MQHVCRKEKNSLSGFMWGQPKAPAKGCPCSGAFRASIDRAWDVGDLH